MIHHDTLDKICTQIIPGFKLSDLPETYQWKYVLMISCTDTKKSREIMGLQTPTGAIFTGSPGNGRHTTAEALAGSLYSNGKNYASVISLHGEDLDFQDPADVAAVLKHISVCAQRAATVLVLDRPELSRHSLAIQRLLVRCQDVLQEQGVRLFVILITEDPEDLDPEVLNAYPTYHCPAPSEKVVLSWFKTILKEPVPIKLAGLNEYTLSERLTGLSWKQLQDFHSHLMRLIVSKWYRFKKKDGETEDITYLKGTVTLAAEDVEPILNSMAAQLPIQQQVVYAAPAQNQESPKPKSDPSPKQKSDPPPEPTDGDIDELFF